MTSLDTNKTIAAHVILELAHANHAGRAVRLGELASEIGVRKADVRQVVTRLHAEGHVDALRLRLTLSGLALAATFNACTLREPLRAARAEERAPLSRVA